MQAPDPNNEEGSESMVRGAGSPSVPGDPMGPGDWDSTGAESTAAEGDPQVESASLDSGPAGEASDLERDLGSEMRELYPCLLYTSDAADDWLVV